eukprot:CAMPEP_0119002980 /NCGR_PEP_ID=MMETSP1176-20130426/273_1 /TAXON_ID=265551 /ORGANISM="Synedropsis recta cf, Strain CCMP1620" /LENGTH=318 /DNA_ID=CAMNT_0006954529 /DNA_START=61 /DNA_END=1017 /DNA_ORIENTATION=-
MNFQSKQTTLKACNHDSMHTNTSMKASMSSLGWIAMLLAFSSASALTTQSPRAMMPGSPAWISDSARNSNDKLRTQPSTGSTKLLYAHGDFADDDYRRDEHNEAVNGVRTRLSTIWTNIFPTPKPESEQEVVDEYLEFLDRRYHRLHDEEETSSTVKPFSTWGWLTDNSSREVSYDAAKSHEDALFVLGVAELASVELLQKHHIVVESVTTDTVIDTKASSSGLFGSVSKPSTSILQKLKNRRRDLIVYQETQMKRVLALSVKTAVTAPSRIATTAKAVWKHSGGKNTIALSVSMLTAAFFFLSAVVGMVFESGFTEA